MSPELLVQTPDCLRSRPTDPPWLIGPWQISATSTQLDRPGTRNQDTHLSPFVRSASLIHTSPLWRHDTMPICIECSYPVSHLYSAYSRADDRSQGKGVRLTQCPRCQRFADKYVEYDFVVIFIDLVLIKPQVRETGPSIAILGTNGKYRCTDICCSIGLGTMIIGLMYMIPTTSTHKYGMIKDPTDGIRF